MNSECKPSSFIAKFYSILNNQNFEEVIKYDQTHATILILNKDRLEAEILPYFYRHSNFASFIRQLNIYGFKKVKKTRLLHFTHPALARGEHFLAIVAKSKAQQPERLKRDAQTRHFLLQNEPNNSSITDPKEAIIPIQNSQLVSNLTERPVSTWSHHNYRNFEGWNMIPIMMHNGPMMFYRMGVQNWSGEVS